MGTKDGTRDHAVLLESERRLRAEANRRRHEEYSSVWDLIAKDGSRKTIEWFNMSARMAIPGWREWSVGIDITERRRLEDALREATQHEQWRLGSELHDGLGQELTGLSLLATALARGLSGIRNPHEGLTEALRELIHGIADPSRGIRFAYVDNSQASLRNRSAGTDVRLECPNLDLEPKRWRIA